MPKSLRDFIARLEAEQGRELIRIKREIDPSRFEATGLIKQLLDRGETGSVLFEQTRDVQGRSSGYRLFMQMFGDQRKTEIALDLPPMSRMELVKEYMALEGRKIKPVVIDRSEAPVKEVVLVGEQADLDEMPIVRHFEMDGNPYFDMALVGHDPEFGYNSSLLRMMYLDRHHTAVHMSPRHHWTYFVRREEKGESLPSALVLGHHPAFYMGSLTLEPITIDEYEVIGGLMNEPLRLTPSEFYGSGLLVPADAEIVIEGEILAGERVVEGPFSEWTGYYGPQRLRWVFEVKAITHRRDPIHTCLVNRWEDWHINLGVEAGLFKAARAAAPGVKAVAAMVYGLGYNVVISMRKHFEGQPVTAALAAIAAWDNAKHVIIVDEDIDPWKHEDVMWAIATRVQADKDVNIIRGVKGSTLDPSTEHELSRSAMIIDATIPLNRPFERPVALPGWIFDKVKLDDYLPELAEAGLLVGGGRR